MSALSNIFNIREGGSRRIRPEEVFDRRIYSRPRSDTNIVVFQRKQIHSYKACFFFKLRPFVWGVAEGV